MQIKMKNERPTFKPVTLEITFETAKELDMYRKIMSYDIKIPSLIYCNGTDEFYAAQSMMADIHETVVECQHCSGLGVLTNIVETNNR